MVFLFELISLNYESTLPELNRKFSSKLPSESGQPTPWWGSNRAPGSPSPWCQWTGTKKLCMIFFERRQRFYLQDRDGEGGCFAGTRLRLGDHISSLDDRLDGALLDGRGLLETIGVDAPEEYKFNF